jgi:putative flavoprotein involved in K+ transport
MNKKIETVIIGGGQGGLATSYFLKQQGHEHIILEQAAQAGNAWRNDRWDSFTFVTPNWTFKLPGAEYDGDDPQGYMLRREIVRRFEQYVDHFQLPVQYGVRVNAVEQNGTGNGYHIKTGDDIFEARNVVIATGMFQHPRIPPFAAGLNGGIVQLHSGKYRNPGVLPPGAVLVVGSAQSGCQIAEELYQSGRKVYLCVGSAGRVPRRYRGRDFVAWLEPIGFFDRTVDKLPTPRARFSSNPQATGKDGGHTINLHQFVHDGVTLLGHLQDIQENTIRLKPDLKENLAKSDAFEADIVKLVDGYIAQNNLDVPPETLPVLRDGYEVEETLTMNLREAGVTSIIWATGYRFDFSLVRLPVFDSAGFPIQNSGVTKTPGLFFTGLMWQPSMKTGLLLGVGENAAAVAEAILKRKAGISAD